MSSNIFHNSRFSRRNFLKFGLGIAGAGLVAPLLGRSNSIMQPDRVVEAATPGPNLRLVGTDGWINLPNGTADAYYPDPMAPAPYNTYIFGFGRVPLAATLPQRDGYKNHALAPAPLFYVDEDTDYRVELTNVGLTIRPDLFDSHTLHWHGFRNAIPFFDGEPSSALSVPIGRTFTYFYHPRDAGTYMYHCHFEDVEHVHMGMTGVVFVRAKQNQTPLNPGEKYAYNDGDGSTAYDREYVLLLTEVWNYAHWSDAHIQAIEWSTYNPDFYLLNGRVYPDTVLPNYDPDTVYPAGSDGERMRYQPLSSLIQANSGERVLLRVVNLGFKHATMTLPGLKMRVVGKDATFLKNSDGTDLRYDTNTISLGAGESYDAIFTAPTVAAQTTYLIYNRNLTHMSNGGAPGLGGQMTEIRISPSGIPPQTGPNA
jgi:FtsP/CotA-like multicopper oxidase with cupredoxin domain